MAKQQRHPKVQRTCKQCGEQFLAHQYAVDAGKGVFCSQECSWKSKVRPRTQRTCKQCGVTFFGKRESIFCSNKCTTEANRRPKVQRTCKHCGKKFFLHQQQIDSGLGVNCSRKCMGESQRRPLPVYTCQCCGKVFALGSKKPGRKYCSRGCFQKVRAIAAKAAKAAEKPNGGRPHEHDKWRLAVILRDKKCVRCGGLENLQAHHLISWKHHPELRYDMKNGVALCPFCHHAQHPYLPLKRFVASGGKTVKYCVVCENAFLVSRESQRVCSRKCGWKRKQQAAAMSRSPA